MPRCGGDRSQVLARRGQVEPCGLADWVLRENLVVGVEFASRLWSFESMRPEPPTVKIRVGALNLPKVFGLTGDGGGHAGNRIRLS